MVIRLSIIKRLFYQVRIRLIWQLISDISRVLQKLLKYFNDTIISTSFVPILPVKPVILSLSLNDAMLSAAWKLAIATAAVKACSSV